METTAAMAPIGVEQHLMVVYAKFKKQEQRWVFIVAMGIVVGMCNLIVELQVQMSNPKGKALNHATTKPQLQREWRR